MARARTEEEKTSGATGEAAVHQAAKGEVNRSLPLGIHAELGRSRHYFLFVVLFDVCAREKAKGERELISQRTEKMEEENRPTNIEKLAQTATHHHECCDDGEVGGGKNLFFLSSRFKVLYRHLHTAHILVFEEVSVSGLVEPSPHTGPVPSCRRLNTLITRDVVERERESQF